jgi:U6 snRNA-associated Sm-like protein LSm8
MSQLQSFVNHTIQVLTADGRIIIGILKGFDQTTNLILSQSKERVFSSTEDVQELQLGLYLIRGDNMYVFKF